MSLNSEDEIITGDEQAHVNLLSDELFYMLRDDAAVQDDLIRAEREFFDA